MDGSATAKNAEPEVLGVDDAVAYWNERHRKEGALASGGDISNDDASNELFYTVRLGRLLDIVGDGADTRAPRRMLDAGCGKGFFTRSMATVGHRVDGIDSSEHAIEVCRSLAVERDRYEVSGLNTWQPLYLYDVVFSVDVLFHIMDEDLWEDAVRNLASLVRWQGLLVLADHDRAVDRVWGNYQKTRAVGRYDELITGLGFRKESLVPYRFRHTPVGFNVYTRVA
ncbi:MAG: hypothetical protein QOG53_1098 [Frankiales bacterium]|jgi:2-polyprenyl-3-methyl-5-hydroxy-6-metoxy-1,4-benzoquinol methylase|nr:hypothetical protein [Frankiales bacterium]